MRDDGMQCLDVWVPKADTLQKRNFHVVSISSFCLAVMMGFVFIPMCVELESCLLTDRC